MELVITEIPDDVSVKYRCDLCDYNPYQAWCKGNVARFHAALMKHKQTRRHIEAEAFSRGEQPVSINKEGVVSADPPTERPPHFYISKLESMIDKLNDRIDALNNAYDDDDSASSNNQNSFGSLVDDFRQNESYENEQKNGESVILNVPIIQFQQPHEGELRSKASFQFKEAEYYAMEKFGDNSCITNTNTLNAVQRCLTWCDVMVKDEEKKARNVAYLSKTKDMIRSLCALMAEGWRADREDYDLIGVRLDNIMRHRWEV